MTGKPPLVAAAPFLPSDEQYGQLQAALVLFFRSRGSAMPGDHASDVILIVLEAIDRGVVIEDLHAYAHGVAKNVLHQHWQEANRNLLPIVNEPSVPDEHLERCLERCLRCCLSKEERRLIQSYHNGKAGAKKIVSHRELAEELGISLEALRLRAHRLRKKLACCVQDCRQQSASPKKRNRLSRT